MITAQDVGNQFWNLSGVRTVEFEEEFIIVHLYSIEHLDELQGWETLYSHFLTEEQDHPQYDLTEDDPTIVFSFEKHSADDSNRSVV